MRVRQRDGNRLWRRVAVRSLVVACLLAATRLHAAPPPTRGATKTEPVTVGVAVRRAFGAGVEIAAGHRPYFLTGEFNGDRFRDWLIVVRVKPSSGTLAKSATILNPWGIRKPPHGKPSGLALAVIHGSKNGWDKPLGRYLLSDREFFATPIWQDATPRNLIGIVRKPGTNRPGRRKLPRAAKGDAIRVATEAGIDTFLYWDGKTYRLYSPPEVP